MFYVFHGFASFLPSKSQPDYDPVNNDLRMGRFGSPSVPLNLTPVVHFHVDRTRVFYFCNFLRPIRAASLRRDKCLMFWTSAVTTVRVWATERRGRIGRA